MALSAKCSIFRQQQLYVFEFYRMCPRVLCPNQIKLPLSSDTKLKDHMESGARAISILQGDMIEASNEEWTYCVLLPEMMIKGKFVEGRAFGVGPNSDSTHVYDKLFEQNTSTYNVLTMCIYERSVQQKCAKACRFLLL